VALATLQRVVNADQQVMQRHRNTIIAPWKDIDAYNISAEPFFQDYHTHPRYKSNTTSLGQLKRGKVNLGLQKSPVFSDLFSV